MSWSVVLLAMCSDAEAARLWRDVVPSCKIADGYRMALYDRDYVKLRMSRPSLAAARLHLLADEDDLTSKPMIPPDKLLTK